MASDHINSMMSYVATGVPSFVSYYPVLHPGHYATTTSDISGCTVTLTVGAGYQGLTTNYMSLPQYPPIVPRIAPPPMGVPIEHLEDTIDSLEQDNPAMDTPECSESSSSDDEDHDDHATDA